MVFRQPFSRNRLVTFMSKKKNKEVQKELADIYEVPKEIENLDDNVALSKPLIVKIIKDMLRGERERYKRYVMDVSTLKAKVDLLGIRADILSKKQEGKTSTVANVTKVDRMDDELTELNERVNEISDSLDTMFCAYNCMQDYPKHSSYKTLMRDTWDVDEDANDDIPPGSSIVDCSTCSFRIDEYSSKGYKYDSLYGKCCNKHSAWFRQIVSGKRHCDQYYAALKNATAHSSYQAYYNRKNTSIVPSIRVTNKPMFFGFDFETNEGEEVQCLKD
jgi:hypothetical protein